MQTYKGYQLVRRHNKQYARWIIVGSDGWTVARANTIKQAKALIDEGID